MGNVHHEHANAFIKLMGIRCLHSTRLGRYVDGIHRLYQIYWLTHRATGCYDYRNFGIPILGRHDFLGPRYHVIN